MKNPSPFSPEALGLGPVEIEPVAQPTKTSETTLHAKKQIKLRKLLEFLQSAAENNPEILELPVFHVEFGVIANTTNVIIDPVGIIFAS